MREPSLSIGADEPRVHSGRPVDPKAAGLRREKNPLNVVTIRPMSRALG